MQGMALQGFKWVMLY